MSDGIIKWKKEIRNLLRREFEDKQWENTMSADKRNISDTFIEPFS